MHAVVAAADEYVAADDSDFDAACDRFGAAIRDALEGAEPVEVRSIVRSLAYQLALATRRRVSESV